MAKDIEIYTLKEVQEVLGVSRRTLYEWIKTGKLDAFMAGKSWRVRKEALEDFTHRGTEPHKRRSAE